MQADARRRRKCGLVIYWLGLFVYVARHFLLATCDSHKETLQMFRKFLAPCRLREEMRCRFICSLRHYIGLHCFLVHLASPLTSVFLYLCFLPYLLPYLPFCLRMGPLRFQVQAWCRKRRQTCRACMLLWQPIVMGRPYLLQLCFLSSIFFFPPLFSAVADWMSTILSYMRWS